MGRQWTEAQKRAIEARGCDLAVSAAAGSGKTSVLTERILSLISEPEGIDAAKLAVVTFTKAAAQELEDRLYSALSERVSRGENASLLSRQLFRLSRAQISTIHSFAFSIVKEYKRELGLGEKLRIADPAEAATLHSKAIEEALSEFFSTEKGPVSEHKEDLYRLFGSARSSARLSETVLRIHEKADSYPGSLSLLRRRSEEMIQDLSALKSGEKTFFDTPYGKEILLYFKEKGEESLSALDTLCALMEKCLFLSEKYLPYFETKRESAKEILSLAENGRLLDAGKLALEVFSEKMPTIRSCPPEEEDQKALCRDLYAKRVKQNFLTLAQDYWLQTTPAILSDMEKTAILSRLLLDLSELALEKYRDAKREKDLVDYSDLEHMTLSLVAEEKDGVWQKSPLADKIGEEYDAVFVDEYQDTNAIQDLIFRAIAREGRLFVVGDPKQSIYRFRGAEPSIFSRYKNDLPEYPSPEKGMKKILLSDNFRCDESVIDFVNGIFRIVMDETAEDSLYREKDRLRYSKIPDEGEGVFPAELVLVQKPQEETSCDAEFDDERISEEENLEAAYLAGRIGSILSGEAESCGEKTFSPSDIAVICRTHLQIARVKKALDLRGIPNTAEAGASLSEEPEYLFVTSLLSALDNPTRDIPLLATLSSPVFRFSADALYRIRKISRHTPFYAALSLYAKEGEHAETAEKCREALEILHKLREESVLQTSLSFLFLLYRRFGIDALYQKDSSRRVREYLFAAATRADGMEIHSPGAFSRFLEEEEPTSPDTGEGVRLMTIHKSKGLEFPIVFVSFLAQPFSTRDESATLLLSPRFGALLSLPLLEGRAKVNTLLKKAARIQMHREAVEEEKRVLYVAFTRARNKLILTASPSNLDKVRSESLSALEGVLSHSLTCAMVRSASSPLALILPALRNRAEFLAALERGESVRGEKFAVEIASPLPFQVWEEACQEAEEEAFSAVETEKALSFQYESQAMETLPKKLSVSQILKEQRQEEAPEFYPRRLLDFEKGVLQSGAERVGTATHRVMQFASFENMEKDAEKEYARLVQEGFLSKEDMALVEKEQVEQFFRSPLYLRMKKSRSVVHEKRFHVFLDAKALGVGKEGEVLIQGVVDAWFENPDGTLSLLDFKTDRVKGKEGEAVLSARHGEQLRLYALAVEKITGKKVAECYLYSFSLGKEIPLSFS